MTTVYPAVDSPEFDAAWAGALADLRTLGELCDRYGVRRREDPAIDDETVAGFEQVTERLNALDDALREVYAYLHAFVATDSRDDAAQARTSELQTALLPLQQLETRYTAWIGSGMAVLRNVLASTKVWTT